MPSCWPPTSITRPRRAGAWWPTMRARAWFMRPTRRTRSRRFFTDSPMQYVAPRWLPGGNLQTIWPALWARRVEAPLPAYRRERWTTPDGDFVDVDFLVAEGPAPRPL